MPHLPPPGARPSLTGTLLAGRIELCQVLGIGAYGVVYLAFDHLGAPPSYVAVKCLQRRGLDDRQRHFQRREIALHSLAAKHRNVVSIHHIFEDETYTYVVLDYCEDGDLFGMITDSQRYIGNDDLVRSVYVQIIKAVKSCHDIGIFHRDLKPENILCTEGGTVVRLADFGLATTERESRDFGCGSTFYLSPECQGGLFERLTSYSTAANDLWSLGVILVNLTCGRNPWRQACPNDETFRAYVHNSDFLRTILPISRATNEILKGLFSLDPAKRTDVDTLLEQVNAVDTFTMTDDELRYAHEAARTAAAAVRVVPPAAQLPPPIFRPVPVLPSTPAISVPATAHAAHLASAVSATAEYPLALPPLGVRLPYATANKIASQRWPYGPQSANPVASPAGNVTPLEDPTSNDHKVSQSKRRAPHYNNRLISTSPPHMLASSSCSSSSGDGDLPYTPEVQPLDPLHFPPMYYRGQTYETGQLKPVAGKNVDPIFGIQVSPLLHTGTGYQVV